MKILVVMPWFYPATDYGGPIFNSLNTCRELAKQHDVFVVTTNANGNKKLDVPANKYLSFDQKEKFKVKYYNETIIGRFSWSLAKNIAKDIKTADVIHIQIIFSISTPLALYWAMKLKKPVLLSARGVMGDWIMNQGLRLKFFWLRWLIKPFAKNIYWHATSEQEVTEIKMRFPDAKVILIPNGISNVELDLKKYGNKQEYFEKLIKTRIAKNDKIIASLGRIHKKKGFDILIRVLKLMPDNVRLVIAGNDEGELSNLLELVKQLEIEDRVFFVGILGHQSIYPFLYFSDVFALSSHNENFGNVYLEALACGTPIVASEHTPWTDVEARNVGICSKNEIEDFRISIEKVLAKDKLEYTTHCVEYASEFSWEKIGKKFIKTFENLSLNT